MRNQIAARRLRIALAAIAVVAAALTYAIGFGAPAFQRVQFSILVVSIAVLGFVSCSPSRRKKLRESYAAFALTAFSCVMALLVINAGLSVAFAVRDALKSKSNQTNPVATRYGDDALARVYPGRSREEIGILLNETRTWPFEFEPFTQFKEGRSRGEYVNLHEAGFRMNGATTPQVWPPSDECINIFVFGGSTTFGYGVPDDKTIPSQLESYLAGKISAPVAVYNFGRGHYFSTQERILFEQLILGGHTPDIAIFIDGLNDFCHSKGLPAHSPFLGQAVQERTMGELALSFVSSSSVGRLATAVQNRIGKAQDVEDYENSTINEQVIDRYLRNKIMVEAVADTIDAETLFVWQPSPTYKYDDVKYHLFRSGGYAAHTRTQYGYVEMADRLKDLPRSDNFLWLADMQQDRQEALYVDILHYTAEFSRDVAKAIGDCMIERGMFVDLQ